jgi:Domain of unknown function (DUF4307)
MDADILSLDAGRPTRTRMPLPRPSPGTARWWLVGSVGVLLSVGVIIWWGVVSTVGGVRPEVTGYRVESDASVLVEYDLHRPSGTAVRCRVIALDGSKARVGTVDDAVPADGPTSVHREVRIRTSVRAVTGVVDSCVRVSAPPP